MDFKKVVVIGAGVMGVGVAQNLVQTGHEVVLIDVSDSILDRACTELRNGLRSYALFHPKEKIDATGLLERVTFTTDYAQAADADFVVENATENENIKREIYATIDRICRPSVVFAANTSAISITRIGAMTRRQERVVGMHFMNPVPEKPMVEVIRGYHTTEETLGTAKAFLGELGKEPVVVEDMPGFVSNRVLMLTINEAIYLVQDQVSNPADIDKIFRGCFGHTMGPLATADLIGLDTILYSIEVLYQSYNDDKYRPCPLLKKMVDAGLYGRKSGTGFFEYR